VLIVQANALIFFPILAILPPSLPSPHQQQAPAFHFSAFSSRVITSSSPFTQPTNMAREMAAGLFSHAPPVAAEQEVVAEDGCEVEHGLGAGRGKLCARGHWRPAEDAKLKELVAQHGPQNWNLIAEKLDGRSGNQRNTIMWRAVRSWASFLDSYMVRVVPDDVLVGLEQGRAAVCVGSTSWTRASTGAPSRRRRRSGCWRRTSPTATGGPSSRASSPAAPTTPSRTTGTSSWRAGSASSSARSAAAIQHPRRRRSPHHCHITRSTSPSSDNTVTARRRCRSTRTTACAWRRWPPAFTGAGAPSPRQPAPRTSRSDPLAPRSSAPTRDRVRAVSESSSLRPVFCNSLVAHMATCSFVRAAGCDTVARPAAPSPVAFSALSPEAAPEDCGNRVALPFFDFLGVGAT
jgi:hypothetical protein